jgi:hypothetical protein
VKLRATQQLALNEGRDAWSVFYAHGSTGYLWVWGRSANWPFYTDRNRDRYEAEAARRRSSRAFSS